MQCYCAFSYRLSGQERGDSPVVAPHDCSEKRQQPYSWYSKINVLEINGGRCCTQGRISSDRIERNNNVNVALLSLMFGRHDDIYLCLGALLRVQYMYILLVRIRTGYGYENRPFFGIRSRWYQYQRYWYFVIWSATMRLPYRRQLLSRCYIYETSTK